eukprot:215419-Chlamydomonas_euryale.AAC.15
MHTRPHAHLRAPRGVEQPAGAADQQVEVCPVAVFENRVRQVQHAARLRHHHCSGRRVPPRWRAGAWHARRARRHHPARRRCSRSHPPRRRARSRQPARRCTRRRCSRRLGRACRCSGLGGGGSHYADGRTAGAAAGGGAVAAILTGGGAKPVQEASAREHKVRGLPLRRRRVYVAQPPLQHNLRRAEHLGRACGWVGGGGCKSLAPGACGWVHGRESQEPGACGQGAAPARVRCRRGNDDAGGSSGEGAVPTASSLKEGCPELSSAGAVHRSLPATMAEKWESRERGVKGIPDNFAAWSATAREWRARGGPSALHPALPIEQPIQPAAHLGACCGHRARLLPRQARRSVLRGRAACRQKLDCWREVARRGAARYAGRNVLRRQRRRAVASGSGSRGGAEEREPAPLQVLHAGKRR